MRKLHLKYPIPDQAEESKAVGKVFKTIAELKEKNYSFSVREKYLILDIKSNDIPQDLIAAIADLPFNTMSELSLCEEDEVKVPTSASEETISGDETGESKEGKEEEDSDYIILSKDIINLVQNADLNYFFIKKVGIILDDIFLLHFNTDKNFVEFYNSNRNKFVLLVESVVREIAEGKKFDLSFELLLRDYFGDDAHIAKEYLYQYIEDYCERRGIQIEQKYSEFFYELISLM